MHNVDIREPLGMLHYLNTVITNLLFPSVSWNVAYFKAESVELYANISEKEIWK